MNKVRFGAHNVSREFWSFDEIEYELGLLDINNKPTKSGELFKSLVKKYRENGFTAPKRESSIIMPRTDQNGAVTSELIWQTGHRYAECVRAGIYPQIILPENADDAEYLSSRGIKNII